MQSALAALTALRVAVCCWYVSCCKCAQCCQRLPTVPGRPPRLCARSGANLMGYLKCSKAAQNQIKGKFNSLFASGLRAYM